MTTLSGAPPPQPATSDASSKARRMRVPIIARRAYSNGSRTRRQGARCGAANHLWRCSNRDSMPSMPKTTTLVSHVNDIVARAARELAGAVREAVAEEVKRISGTAQKPSPRPAAAPTALKGRGRKGRRRGIDPAQLDKVIALLAKKPGLRSEQIQKTLGFDKVLTAKLLVKLREQKRVKVKGVSRATSYSAA
jgi:hypothetical protein